MSAQNNTNWLALIIIVVIGLLIIASNWSNLLNWVVGVALAFGSLVSIPEVRLRLRVIINHVSKREISQVQQEHISDSNVIGTVHGDVYVGNLQPKMAEKQEEIVEYPRELSRKSLPTKKQRQSAKWGLIR